MHIFLCTRCNEQFFQENVISTVRCPSCGCTKYQPKTINYDVNQKSIVLEHVSLENKQEGIIKINISGEKKKALFLCKGCLVSFESDCTEGLHVVSCPVCHSKEFDIKSPVVSVFAGIKGIPLFSQKQLTKTEIKKFEFAKNCYRSYLELDACMTNLVRLLIATGYPKEDSEKISQEFENVLKAVDNIHTKKIEEYSGK